MLIFSSSEKEPEDQLVESLHFIEQVARHAPGMLLVIDLLEYKITFINKWTADHLGISASEACKKERQYFQEILYPEDYSRFINHLSTCTALADEADCEIEVRLRVRGGDWHWFRIKNVAFRRDKHGKVAQAIGLGMDIQSQKDAEERAIEKQHELLNAQAFGHIGSFERELNSENIKASDELYRIHGLEPQQETLTFQKIVDFVHPDDREDFQRVLKHGHLSGEPQVITNRIIRRDGSIRYIHRRTEYAFDAQGSPVRVYGIIQDVSDVVESHKKNQAQETLLREAEKVGNFGSYVGDVNTLSFQFSDGMYRLLGYEPQAFEPTLDLIDAASHPDDVQPVRKILQQAAKDKKPYEYYRRVYRPDGQMRCMHSQGKVVADANGQAVQYLGIARDVTELKTAEKELKQKNELLEGVMNSPNVGITVYKSVRNEHNQIVDFEYVLMSKLAIQHAGNTTLVGKRLLEINPEMIDQLHILRNVVETGEITEHEAIYTEHQDERWYFNSCAKLNDGVIKVWEDITQRKQAEEKLRQSLHFIQNITQTSPNIMFVFDIQKDKVVYVNKGLEAITGHSIDEFMRLDLSGFLTHIHPDDHENALSFQQSLRNAGDDDIEEVELRFKNTEGAWRWFHKIGRVFMRDEQGQMVQYLAIMRDVTEQKQTQSDLIEAEKLSVQGGMARTLAHEVRGPAANINLSLQLLRDDLANKVDISEETQVYFDIISKSCKRITNFITELMHVSTGHPEDMTVLDLAGLLDDALMMAQDRVYLQGVSVQKNYPRGVKIRADRERLKIALLNIIINAIEAMEEKKGVLQLSIRDAGSYWSLSVQDNGTGMSSEQKAKMFDAYYTSKPNGLGVGLANVKAILEAHQAEVDVRSEQGVGTAFILSFKKP